MTSHKRNYLYTRDNKKFLRNFTMKLDVEENIKILINFVIVQKKILFYFQSHFCH